MINRQDLYEKIYSIENRLIEAVLLGEEHNARLIAEEFPSGLYDSAAHDFLKTVKCYCVSLNALLRKAAERSGVEPQYIFEKSDEILVITENITQGSFVKSVITEIAVSYAQLVKYHCRSDYSSPVSRAIIKIHHDLTADISLNALAEFNNISPVYFSGLFKAETGVTLTDYVNHKRIERAKYYLENTHLHIKEISVKCGMDDINYFSKLFKKLEGITPKEYRTKHSAL